MNTREFSERSGLVVGAVLVGLGVIFLIGQLTDINLGAFVWPFYVIVPGLACLAVMTMSGKPYAGLAVPGSIITTVGLILFYQNATNHWQSWAYAWTLLITAVGVGNVLAGSHADDPDRAANGRRTVSLGLVMFVLGFIFFELVIGISGLGGALRTFGLPLGFILLGFLILFRGTLHQWLPWLGSNEDMAPVATDPSEPILER